MEKAQKLKLIQCGKSHTFKKTENILKNDSFIDNPISFNNKLLSDISKNNIEIYSKDSFQLSDAKRKKFLNKSKYISLDCHLSVKNQKIALSSMGSFINSEICDRDAQKYPQLITQNYLKSSSKSFSFQDLINSASLIQHAIRSISPRHKLKTSSFNTNLSSSSHSINTVTNCLLLDKDGKWQRCSEKKLYAEPTTLKKSLSNYIIGSKLKYNFY